MSFRRRNYTEVLSNLLTGILGGVTAEAHAFPPSDGNGPPYTHVLETPPVADVVAVYGSRNGQSHEFSKGSDYILNKEKQTVQWQDGAQLPDDGTLFYVNYLPESAQAKVSDLQVGSVVRTLTESIGLEIARLYAQLEGVYKSGFVDTATATALDNVVALLGIARVRAGRFSGEIVFSRAAGSRGAVHIPAGTRVMTRDGNVEYETVSSVSLLDGQNAVRVVARDVEANTKGLDVNMLKVLAKPIAGIADVTNPAPTKAADTDESDAELRARAKNFLHGSERATLGALREAVTRQGILADVEEVKDEQGHQVGRVLITPHAETLAPELRQRINAAIEDARPAGVYVQLAEKVTAPTKVNLTLRVVTAGDLLEQDLRAARETMQEKIADYFAKLPVKEPASLNRIIGLVLSVPEIQDVQIQNANLAGEPPGTELPDLTGKTTVLGELEIVDPNLPTLLQILISHPPAADPLDQSAIDSKINSMLAYLNEMNAVESLDDESRRTLTYAKLLFVLPLPPEDKPQGTLQEYDQGVAAGLPPDLPGPEDIAPYGVQFVFILQSGLSRIVKAPSDFYDLKPFERLSLSGVEIKEESGDG